MAVIACSKCGQVQMNEVGKPCIRCGEILGEGQKEKSNPGAEGKPINRKCPKCGLVQTLDGARCCPKCGGKLEISKETSRSKYDLQFFVGLFFIGCIGVLLVKDLGAFLMDKSRKEVGANYSHHQSDYSTYSIDSDTERSNLPVSSTDVPDDYKLALYMLAQEEVKKQLKTHPAPHSRLHTDPQIFCILI